DHLAMSIHISDTNVDCVPLLQLCVNMTRQRRRIDVNKFKHPDAVQEYSEKLTQLLGAQWMPRFQHAIELPRDKQQSTLHWLTVKLITLIHDAAKDTIGYIEPKQ